MRATACTLWFLCTMLTAAHAFADQNKIANYRTARDTHFWSDLYRNGGFTLYCGRRFSDRSGLNVEHVYPASWMKQAAGCANRTREQCRKLSKRFNRMEADLHNLYPALEMINKARSSFEFDVVEGEKRHFGSCDFEIDKVRKVAEPRAIARGNVARAIFHMHTEYGLPVPQRMRALLLRWHTKDPPSAHERRRNNAIERIQGTRNRFVDKPREADKLKFIAVVTAPAVPQDRNKDVLERMLKPGATSEGFVSFGSCCKVCRKGKACGNTCISRSKTCRKPPGCACNAR